VIFTITVVELAAVVTAWPSLPEAVRAGIVAMVKESDREP
jgi:hypothetical protein